jgi:uncharacterized membrane protein
MNESEIEKIETGSLAKFAYPAAIAALVGLADSVYLTVKHFLDEKVPCSLVTGCEQVLTSQYAEIFGVPTAAFGAVAYFAVFSLAILAAFGNRRTWFLFGLTTALMLVFTLWLLYLQAFVIKAFCQFCLLSAATSSILFIIAVVSKFWRFK